VKNLTAPIVAVTVYVDRARVTRRGIVHLSPGEDVVSVGPIPLTMDVDSVRTSGKGANVRIAGAEVGTRYVTETPDVDAAEMQHQLEALNETKRTLADDDAAENERLKLLQSLRDASGARFAKAIAAGQAGVDNFRPLAAYLDEELRELQARRRDIATKQKALEKEIQVLEARLKQSHSSTAQEWREVLVVVEATTEANLELEVTYVVANATWEPLYDVRLVDTSVTVTYLAQVRQQTGEDWPAVGAGAVDGPACHNGHDAQAQPVVRQPVGAYTAAHGHALSAGRAGPGWARHDGRAARSRVRSGGRTRASG
jgi:uncharacterized protein (TIGR02231 family)